MNMKTDFAINDLLKIPYKDTNLVPVMSKKIISCLPVNPREYVVVCIGTDRSTGDSLGPLTGTFLNKLKPKHLTVYGDLHDPVHAQNLNDFLQHINKTHFRPFIIAIDACLGRKSSVGNIMTGTGSIIPGAALNKDLPEVGNLYITGVVNVSGFMEYTVLQSTRLSIVVDMANQIASILDEVDQQLTSIQKVPAVVNFNHKK